MEAETRRRQRLIIMGAGDIRSKLISKSRVVGHGQCD